MMFQKMLLEVPDNDNDMIMVAKVDLHSPKLAKAPEHRPSPKETSLPTIHFQGLR